MSKRTPCDYTVMVFERGDLKWSLVARERKADAAWAAAERFRLSRPEYSYGRILFGACDRDMTDAELSASIASIPAPVWLTN